MSGGADRPRTVDGASVALVAFVVYLLLRQDCAYGDATGILLRNHGSPALSGYHVLYPQMLWLFRQPCSLLGLTFFEVAGVFSAFGAALGTFLCHVAFRVLGSSRARAVVATALVATCPAVVFFATVVEFHGPFMILVGLASIATAALARWPSWPAAMSLGLATGLAYFGHATAYVMPGVLYPVACAGILMRGRVDGRALARCARLVVPVAIAHFGVVHGATAWFEHTGLFPEKNAAGTWLGVQAGLFDSDRSVLASAAYDEFLEPYLPMSIAVIAGWFVPRARWLCFAVTLALAPYLALVFVALAGRFYERGAYLLPFVWPLAWLTVTLVPARVAALCVPVAGLVGVLLVLEHESPERPHAWGEGLRAVSPPAETLIMIGDWEGSDVESLFVGAPEYEFFDLTGTAFVPRAQVVEALPLLEKTLHDEIAKRNVFLTEGAEALLRSDPVPGERLFGNDLVWLLLETRFDLEPVEHGGFRAKRVLEKR